MRRKPTTDIKNNSGFASPDREKVKRETFYLVNAMAVCASHFDNECVIATLGACVWAHCRS